MGCKEVSQRRSGGDPGDAVVAALVESLVESELAAAGPTAKLDVPLSAVNIWRAARESQPAERDREGGA